MRKKYISLRRRIEDAGYSQQELAEKVGMGVSTLSKRMGNCVGSGEWRSSEITAICKVVGIPREQIGEYFFPEVKKE
ncbi:MAG: DUF739 family protein [Faecalibacterium prausnitzii]|nr:DUF739 family protein [Faecalibacterium prausnitzii]